MKNYVILFFIFIALSCCKKNIKAVEEATLVQERLTGEWDNFQQYWLENTQEDKHRVETDNRHRHFSLKIDSLNAKDLTIEIREGRNGKNFIETIKISSLNTNGDFRIDGDTLFVSRKKPFENKDPYKFIRVRKFSGWVEAPKSNSGDGVFRNDNLVIHDQGGMAELVMDGEHYTVELTQLLFAKKLAIMKLAIYEMPLDSVGINSRSISYTWTNPEAKRLGINLRKVLSGWTFIEPGFQNQNSWKTEKKQ